MAKIDIFVKMWWTLTPLRHSTYANFDNFQNCILLNMNTNVVLTFAHENIIRSSSYKTKIKDKTLHFSHQNEWFFICQESDSTHT